ncbi:class I SAM-dependent methyltransferase [Streptomyces cellulosae]
MEAAALYGTDTVLDIGCGNGSVTRLAARRARRAVGIDLSAPMLERARATAEAAGIPHVTHVQGDAQVHAFEPASFEVAVSRYGVMFFADPVAAFTNIAGALREGGRLAFVCPQSFDRQDQAEVFAAVSEHAPLPDLTAASETGPASFADPARVRAVLSAAGFEEIEVTPLEAEQVWGTDPSDASERLFGWGPMRHWLRDAPEDAVERAREAATGVFGGGGGVRDGGRGAAEDEQLGGAGDPCLREEKGATWPRSGRRCPTTYAASCTATGTQAP